MRASGRFLNFLFLLPVGLRVESQLPAKQLLPAWESKEAISVSLPKGSLENPSSLIRLQDLSWTGRELRVGDFLVQVGGSRWSYRESVFLKLECEAPRLEFRKTNWVLQLPPRLDVGLEISPDAPAKITDFPAAELRAALERSLGELWTEASLAQGLRLHADCPGATARLLESFLRARLTDFGRKDEATVRTMLDQLEARAREALEKALRDELGDWKPSGNLQARVRIEISPEGILSLSSLDASGASPQESPREARPLKGSLRWTLTPGFFENFARPWIEASPLSVTVTVPSDFAVEDFAPLFPELADRPDTEGLTLEVGIVRCAEESPVRVRPWISRDAMKVGVDVEAGLLVTFRTSGGLRFERGIPLRAVFENPSRWKFAKVDWLASKQTCGLTNLDPVLGETFQWLLSSEGLQQLAKEKLEPELARLSDAFVRPRVLGQASFDRRRPGGGYYADAIVLETPASR